MKCICENEMKFIEFGDKRVFYCDLCMTFDVEYFDCEHKNYKLIALKMSNDKIMVKKFCTDCEHTFDNPVKQLGIDISKLHNTTNESYHNFRTEKDRRFLIAYSEFIKNRTSIKSLLAKSAYSDYVNSENWKRKRELAIKRDNETCQICGNKFQDVHHLTYQHKENEYVFELVCLCRKCHIEHYHPERKAPELTF